MIGDLPGERLKAIFAAPDSCVAGAATPPERAVAAGGGYRITGRWAWASGIHGHFAVEDCLHYISSNMHRFYDEKVASANAISQ
jgi:hypothetical protein